MLATMVKRKSWPRTLLDAHGERLCTAVILAINLLFTACSSIDKRITDVKDGASIANVIQLLGEPNKAWGYGLRGEISFVYVK
jgi:hypothetical protein